MTTNRTRRTFALLIVALALLAAQAIATARPTRDGIAWNDGLIIESTGIYYCGINADC